MESRRLDNFLFSLSFRSIISKIGETVELNFCNSSLGGRIMGKFLKSVLLNFGCAEPLFIPRIKPCPSDHLNQIYRNNLNSGISLFIMIMLFPSVIGASSVGQRNTLPTSPTLEIIISPPKRRDFDKKS